MFKVCQEPPDFRAGRLHVFYQCSEGATHRYPLPEKQMPLPALAVPYGPQLSFPSTGTCANNFGDHCTVIPGPLGYEI